MDEKDFEGTRVLEKLAEINKIDDFFEAIDSDNFGKVKSLLKQAQLDSDTISQVLKMMNDGES